MRTWQRERDVMESGSSRPIRDTVGSALASDMFAAVRM